MKTKIEDIVHMLLAQHDDLVGIVERQQKRIHNLEIAVMSHHSMNLRIDADKVMENFFDASAPLGAFTEVEFKTAE